MKIIRLKRGYSIRLTDAEFAALDHLVAHGRSDFQENDPEQYGITGWTAHHIRGRFAEIAAMRIDEDRR